MNLGENIKTARKAAGVTQKELAERLQVYQKDISRWENNELTPNAITLAKICRELNASADEILDMKKVDFNKLQAGDLVEVPRTQFAPMRSGWNGWLFSEAVVIRKGVGRKSKKNVVVVEMRTPAGKNSYGTIEATFYAENVFTTPAAKNARNILKKYGIEDAESFYKFIERDDVTGCDWIRFLIEKGFLFNE